MLRAKTAVQLTEVITMTQKTRADLRWGWGMSGVGPRSSVERWQAPILCSLIVSRQVFCANIHYVVHLYLILCVRVHNKKVKI